MNNDHLRDDYKNKPQTENNYDRVTNNIQSEDTGSNRPPMNQHVSNNSPHQIHVSNLPDETTEEDIRSIFSRFGEILNIYLPLNPLYLDMEDKSLFDESNQCRMSKIKGYCIISVSRRESLQSIVQENFTLMSKSLLVREFVQNSVDMDRIDLETCLRRVCVMNIP